jgi:hypothetical protein
MDIKSLINIVGSSAVYVQANCEGVRIDYYDTLEELTDDMEEDELGFYGTGEDTGEQYKIPYSEINLKEDLFYKLVLVDIPVE